MTDTKLPVIRLNPKANARAIRHGFPWAYDNEIVTDRRTRGLAPGALAILQDNDRNDLGLATVNPNSKIFARVLDRNADAEFGVEWLQQKIANALDHRNRLFDQPYYRLIHAEADGLPGVVIDRFGDVAVVQPNAAWADVHFDLIEQALTAATGISTIVKNGMGRARKLEGLDETHEVVRGNVDGPIPVQMNGATYLADVLGGQKTGLFFDQRPNHAFAASLAKDADVLDVFSHVGGFSLACLANGAKSALAVDGSQAALDLATDGAKRMGQGDAFSTQKGDAFAVMESLIEEGRKFDVVICDPPAFAPNRKAMEAGLRAYERVARLAAQLVHANGYLGVCSCSHAADLSRFRAASSRGIGRGGRSAQLIHTGFAGPDHPLLPQLAESGYLKALFYRMQN